MGTSKEQIEAWLVRGYSSKCTHVIVACDTYDHSDYPIYCMSQAEAEAKYASHDGVNMQRVMEVYSMALPMESQLKEHRANHLKG